MGLDSALVSAVGAVPAGVVVPFAGATSPSGWLLCHGQAVSRTDYGALFTAIGTTYGTGDGSTTFNLPDLRGRVVAGLDNMGGSAASRLTSTTITGGADGLGEVGGAQTHTLTSSEIPAHKHKIGMRSDGSIVSNNIQLGSSGNTFAFHSTGTVGNVTSGGADGLSYDNTGGGGAHNNVQPTMVLNYIIKASAY